VIYFVSFVFFCHAFSELPFILRRVYTVQMLRRNRERSRVKADPTALK
jgi:hypothetical protein